MNFSNQDIIFNPEKSNPMEQIKYKYECFRKKERIIADHLLSEPHKIIRMSVQEMAKLCACSESSIVRFCQMLGYSGFSQLKLELASRPNPLQISAGFLKRQKPKAVQPKSILGGFYVGNCCSF